MGAIIGALIGRHLAHSEEQHQAARQLTFAPVASYLKDPASSQFTPEQVDQALEQGMKMNYFPKEFKSIIGPMIEAGKSKWQAARNLEAMQAAAKGGGPVGGQDLGVPMNTGTAPTLPPPPAAPPAGPQAAAPAPAQTGTGFNPLSMMGVSQPAPSAPGSAAATGVPPIPFANGAGTGPAPMPDEKPEMRTGSLMGVTGFGGPATGPVAATPSLPPIGGMVTGPVAAAPAPPQAPPLLPQTPAPPTAFWHAGRSPADIATTKSVADAQAQIAAARVLASYGHEKVTNALSILDQMLGPGSRKELTPTQIASFMQNGTIPEVGFHDIPKGGLAVRSGPNGPEFIFGQRDAVQTPMGGTTRILDNPNTQPGVAYSPAHPLPPMPTGPAGEAGMTIKGEPKMSDAQRTANSTWEAKHGKPITPGDYAQAKSEFDESAITPTARKMNDLRAANLQELRASRALREKQLNQTIKEFEATKGPAAIESLTDQVYQNPDLFSTLTGDAKNLVAQRFQAKYNLPAPRPLPPARRDQEDASIISLNHAKAIRTYLKNPVVQQRIGAWDGRLGNLEQAIGDTAGLKPADARVIQDLRSRFNYFFAQESKSAFGGRTAKEFLDEIKASSPRMSMGMPLIEGALDAAEGMAQVNLDSAQQYRYNKAPGSAMGNPPEGMPTHGVPELGSTFNGGKVLRVTPVK